MCTQLASLLALAALQCHLLRRWLETVAVMVYPPHARMHLIAYIFGMRSVWPPTGMCTVPDPTTPSSCCNQLTQLCSLGRVQLLRRPERVAATFSRSGGDATACTLEG